MIRLRWLWIALALLGIAMIGYGVHLGQHGQVEHQASLLCTSCIGLE